MKKAILILPILVLAILTLSGCNDTETKLIDTFTWQMTTIQNGKDGSAVACAPELAEIHEGAKPLRLTCKAKNGNLTITDSTQTISYTGEYSLKQVESGETIYNISIEGNEGYGVTSMTTYHDGDQNPTFIICIEPYTINFESGDK